MVAVPFNLYNISYGNECSISSPMNINSKGYVRGERVSKMVFAVML